MPRSASVTSIPHALGHHTTANEAPRPSVSSGRSPRGPSPAARGHRAWRRRDWHGCQPRRPCPRPRDRPTSAASSPRVVRLSSASTSFSRAAAHSMRTTATLLTRGIGRHVNRRGRHEGRHGHLDPTTPGVGATDAVVPDAHHHASVVAERRPRGHLVRRTSGRVPRGAAHARRGRPGDIRLGARLAPAFACRCGRRARARTTRSQIVLRVPTAPGRAKPARHSDGAAHGRAHHSQPARREGATEVLDQASSGSSLHDINWSERLQTTINSRFWPHSYSRPPGSGAVRRSDAPTWARRATSRRPGGLARRHRGRVRRRAPWQDWRSQQPDIARLMEARDA